MQLGLGLGAGVRVVLGLGELEEHFEVVDPPAQRLRLADLGLQVRELAGDLLRRLGVVPQGRRGRLLLEHGDVCPQPVEVQDGLDRPHGRGEGLQLFGYIDDCHASKRNGITRHALAPVDDQEGTEGCPEGSQGAPRAVRGPTAWSPGAVRSRRRRSSRASRRRPPPRPVPRRRDTERDAASADRVGLVAGRAGAALAGAARGAGRAARAARELVRARDAHGGVGVPVGVRGASRGPAGRRRGGAARSGSVAYSALLVRPPRSPRRPARPRPAAACPPAAAAGRAAGRRARRRAAGTRAPWPGTGRSAATARRGCRAAGRRSR